VSTADPIGPKKPSDDDKIPPGGVISGTSEGGTPSGTAAGDESGKAGAPGTTVVVTDKPTSISEAPNTVNPEKVTHVQCAERNPKHEWACARGADGR